MTSNLMSLGIRCGTSSTTCSRKLYLQRSCSGCCGRCHQRGPRPVQRARQQTSSGGGRRAQMIIRHMHPSLHSHRNTLRSVPSSSAPLIVNEIARRASSCLFSFVCMWLGVMCERRCIEGKKKATCKESKKNNNNNNNNNKKKKKNDKDNRDRHIDKGIVSEDNAFTYSYTCTLLPERRDESSSSRFEFPLCTRARLLDDAEMLWQLRLHHWQFCNEEDVVRPALYTRMTCRTQNT